MANHHNRVLTRVFWPQWIALFLYAGTSPLFAQQAEEQAALAPIEVVGTRIKRTDWETPTPMQIMTGEEIRRSGAVSVAELLRTLPAGSTGSVQDLALGSTFSAGASTLSLRGLGSSATLILVNGRRMMAAPYADPSPGQSQLFNLNAIPLSAIKHIEVLKGGASALYGSDALAGVLNIVLREDYRGAEAGIKISKNHEGEFGNRHVYGALTLGGSDKEGQVAYRGFLTFSNSRRQASALQNSHNVAEEALAQLFSRNTIQATTLSYPGNYYVESVPGSDVFATFAGRDPRCPATLVLADDHCGYNPYQVLNLVDAQDNHTLSGRLNFDIRRELSLFTEFDLARVKNQYMLPPNSVTQSGSIWFAQDGRRNLFRFILPTGHPDNPFNTPVALRYHFGDIGPIRRNVTTDSYRLMVGMKGINAGWEWESALSRMRMQRETDDYGHLYFPALVNAIASRAYRPFGSNAPATLAAISPRIRETGTATSTGWDIKGTRNAMQLPDGPLALVLGVEMRNEELAVHPDMRVVNGDLVGLGATQAHGQRWIHSLFAELSLPLDKRLETQFAVRHDRYSDYGTSTTPQWGVKWKLTDSLALRSTYAQGFRAPALSTISESNVQSFVGGLSDPLRCGSAAATQEDCNFIGSTLVRANPQLQPERSDNQTIGIIFAPHSRFSMTVDVYRIKRMHEIINLTPQYVIDNAAFFPGAVLRDLNPATWISGIPNSGPIQSIILEFVNLGQTVTRGADIDASYRQSLGEWGKLALQFNGSYLIKFKNRRGDAAPYVESQGGYGPLGALPCFKGNVSLTWRYRDVELSGQVHHVSGWRFGNSAISCATGSQPYLNEYGCQIKPWTTLNAALRYTGIKNLELGFGVRNLQNKPAPLDPGNAALGYHPVFHDPYGRYFSLWLSYALR